MRNGSRIAASRSLREIQSYARSQIDRIPPEMRRLINPEIYWVGLSPTLAERKQEEMLRFWQAV